METGLLKVVNEEGLYSIWSIFKKDFVTPFIDSDSGMFDVDTVQCGEKSLHYIEIFNYKEKISTVYDVFGNIVVNTDQYYSRTITVELESVYINDDNTMSEIYIETVKTVLRKDADKGNYTDNIKMHIIDIDTGSRTELMQPINESEIAPIEIKQDLKEIGLEGYFGKYIDAYLHIYDRNNKLITKFDLSDISAYGGVDGKLLYQKIEEVDIISSDYTYYTGGKKYLLSSYAYDLKAKKLKQLNLGYVIKDFKPFVDKKGKYKYGYINGHVIGDEELIGMDHYFLINANGKVLGDSGSINYLGLKKLGNEHFYDPDSGYVLNNDFEQIHKLGTDIKFSSNKELIFYKKDGFYGAVNYDGKNMIPFHYSKINTEFYCNKVMGVHFDGNRYFVGETGNKQLNSQWSEIAPGLLYRLTYIRDSNIYEFEIVDYNLKRIAYIETSESVSYDFERFTTIYGDFFAVECPKRRSESVYVYIKTKYIEVNMEN